MPEMPVKHLTHRDINLTGLDDRLLATNADAVSNVTVLLSSEVLFIVVFFRLKIKVPGTIYVCI